MKIKPNINVLCIIATKIIGGPGKSLLQLKKEFDRMNINLVICSFTGRDIGKTEFEGEMAKKGYRFYKLKERFRFDPRLIWQAYNLVNKLKIDIIQSHGYKGNVICFLLKKVAGFPWVSFAHGWIPANIKVALFNFLDKILLRFADRIVAVSESMKEKLINAGVNPGKISVVHNAINKTSPISISINSVRKNYNIRKDCILIGVIGRLSREKGQKYFIKAFKKSIRYIPNIKAFIIGDGPDRNRLKKYITDLGLIEYIIFTGHQRNIASFYSAIDLVVMPSLSEELPHVALESLAYEKPLIATSVGGLPEIITNGKNGILVPSADADSLSRAMINLIEDVQLRKRLSLAGKATILSHFTPFKRATAIKQVYKKLLDLKK